MSKDIKSDLSRFLYPGVKQVIKNEEIRQTIDNHYKYMDDLEKESLKLDKEISDALPSMEKDPHTILAVVSGLAVELCYLLVHHWCRKYSYADLPKSLRVKFALIESLISKIDMDANKDV